MKLISQKRRAAATERVFLCEELEPRVMFSAAPVPMDVPPIPEDIPEPVFHFQSANQTAQSTPPAASEPNVSVEMFVSNDGQLNTTNSANAEDASAPQVFENQIATYTIRVTNHGDSLIYDVRVDDPLSVFNTGTNLGGNPHNIRVFSDEDGTMVSASEYSIDTRFSNELHLHFTGNNHAGLAAGESLYVVFDVRLSTNSATDALTNETDAAVEPLPRLDQIGDDITGTSGFFGRNVEISRDGSTAAFLRYNPGFIRTLRYEEAGGIWQTMGPDIPVTETYFAGAVAINATGDVLAFTEFRSAALPRSIEIYEFDGNAWVNSGSIALDGNLLSGYLEISDDGTTIAVGSPLAVGEVATPGGDVAVFRLIDGSWDKIGSISGAITGVDLSADGNTLVIGAKSQNRASVYQWDEAANQYMQRGSDLTGGSIGLSVALTADGNRVALYSGNSSGSRVFDFDGNDWVQVGNILPGLGQTVSDTYDVLTSIDISDDGTRLVIGFGKIISAGNGHVAVYDLRNGQWTQSYYSDFGPARSGFGSSVSLSGDGLQLIASASNSAGPTVRLYELPTPALSATVPTPVNEANVWLPTQVSVSFATESGGPEYTRITDPAVIETRKTYNLGGDIFLDFNRNGRADLSDPVLADVTVNLYRVIDGVRQSQPVQTTQSSNGSYQFTNVPATADLGPNVQYQVEFVPPNGWFAAPVLDGGVALDQVNDISYTNGKNLSAAFDLASADSTNIDAGFVPAVSVQTFVSTDGQPNESNDANLETSGVPAVRDGDTVTFTVKITNHETDPARAVYDLQIHDSLAAWNGIDNLGADPTNIRVLRDLGGTPASGFVVDSENPSSLRLIYTGESDAGLAGGESIYVVYDVVVNSGAVASVEGNTVSPTSPVYNGFWAGIDEIADGSFAAIAATPDGNTVALADSVTKSVSVWQKQGDQWGAIGTSINIGTADFTGYSVSFSDDGQTLVIGAVEQIFFREGTTFAAVYRFNTSTADWVKVGAEFTNSDAFFTGASVATNEDGTVVAVSSPGGGRARNAHPGEVEVYTLVNDTWQQMGSTFVGVVRENFGSKISLSSDGNTLAISFNNKVKVYHFENGDWTQAGADIGADFSPRAVLSVDGNRIAFAYKSNIVRVLEWDGADWTSVGNGDLSASSTINSIAFSPDGNKVSAGTGIFTLNNGEWEIERLAAEISTGMSAFNGDGEQLYIIDGDKVTIATRESYPVSPVVGTPENKANTYIPNEASLTFSSTHGASPLLAITDPAVVQLGDGGANPADQLAGISGIFQGVRYFTGGFGNYSFQPLFMGLTQPGNIVSLEFFGSDGGLIESQTVFADTSGTWIATLTDISVFDSIESLIVRESSAGWNENTVQERRFDILNIEEILSDQTNISPGILIGRLLSEE